MSAQRYPDDFDAILAGAPAQDIRGIIATFLTTTRAMYPDPAQVSTPTLSTADQQALQKAVLAKCDAADGLTDGVLGDPTTCTIRPAERSPCPGGNAGWLPVAGGDRRGRDHHQGADPERQAVSRRLPVRRPKGSRAAAGDRGSSARATSPGRAGRAWPTASASTSFATS